MKNEAGDQVIRVYPGERVCQMIFQELHSPLTPSQANLHGLTSAKYSESSSQNLKMDKEEERELLVSGNLEQLKTRFGI
jgi:deoxycytidine triphosphate deaminase